MKEICSASRLNYFVWICKNQIRTACACIATLSRKIIPIQLEICWHVLHVSLGYDICWWRFKNWIDVSRKSYCAHERIVRLSWFLLQSFSLAIWWRSYVQATIVINMHFVKKGLCNCARKLSYNFSCKILASFLCAARKVSFLVQDLQDMCKISIFIVATVFTGLFNNDSKHLRVCCTKRPTEIHHILFSPPQIKSKRSGLGTRLYQAV